MKIEPGGWVPCAAEHCQSRFCVGDVSPEAAAEILRQHQWHVFPDGSAMCYYSATAHFAERNRAGESAHA